MFVPDFTKQKIESKQEATYFLAALVALTYKALLLCCLFMSLRVFEFLKDFYETLCVADFIDFFGVSVSSIFTNLFPIFFVRSPKDINEKFECKFIEIFIGISISLSTLWKDVNFIQSWCIDTGGIQNLWKHVSCHMKGFYSYLKYLCLSNKSRFVLYAE